MGAGNCNDLSLRELVEAHQEVHLVDIDTDALVQGAVRQNLAHHARIHCHGDIDLTGMLSRVTHWSPTTPISAAELADCLDHSLDCLDPVAGPFDVVASTCILSQLIKTIVDAVGENHPQFLDVVQAIRMGHLRLLMQLVDSGGFGVLITDVVSSDSFPALASVPAQNLSQVLSQLIRAGNFFHGVNPAVLVKLVREDPVLSQQVASLEPISPWLWEMGSRSYAVIGLKLHKGRGIASAV